MKRTLALILVALMAFAAVVCWGGNGIVAHADDPQFSANVIVGLVGKDSDVSLRASSHPEFDAWRWNAYWVPLDVVIEFKRGVYEQALNELARFIDADRKRHLRRGRGEKTAEKLENSQKNEVHFPKKRQFFSIIYIQ